MFAARLLQRTPKTSSRTLLNAQRSTCARLPRAVPSITRSFWVQDRSDQQEKVGPRGEHTLKQDAPPTRPPPPEPEVVFVEEANAWNPYLAALLAVGCALTAYGLYGFYVMMTMWPSEVRKDLRAGLRAKRKKDYEIASQYLARAWETARKMPVEAFGEEPVLKVSGIGIALAGVYEECKDRERAYKTYDDTLWYLRTAYLDVANEPREKVPDLGMETLKVLNAPEKMRAVAIAYKLGELAEALDKPYQEQEKWLVWSVEAILRTVLSAPPMSGAESVTTLTPNGPNVKVLVEQLGLPLWSLSHDLAAPFEALGTFYAKHSNVNYAMPLYLQAISILVPPPPLVSTFEDKCRGAQVMGNIAELLLRGQSREKMSPEVLAQAESWARKGLDIVTTTRKQSPAPLDVCEEAFAVLLYNVALVKELSGDPARARSLLTESLHQAKSIGHNEGIVHANRALKSLDSGDSLGGSLGGSGIDEATAAAALE